MRHRCFVPSTVFDNQILLQNEPQYLASLSMLPRAEREALLYGKWGQLFRPGVHRMGDDPAHYDDRLFTHVIEPFPIPPHWVLYRGFDFGYTAALFRGVVAADETGKLYQIGEYYGTTGTPNEGVRLAPDEIARRIRRLDRKTPSCAGGTF